MSISMCKCISLYTCVFLCMLLCMHTYVLFYEDQSTASHVASLWYPSWFLIHYLTGIWSLNCVGWLASKFQQSACLCLSAWVHSCAITSSYLLKVLGIKPRPSNLKQQVFYWLSSLVSTTKFITLFNLSLLHNEISCWYGRMTRGIVSLHQWFM